MGIFLSFLLFSTAHAAVTVKVTDLSGQAVNQAYVLVGAAENTPFTNNWAKTNPQGEVVFTNVDTIESQPITIAYAANRPNVTYLKQSGSLFNLQIPSEKPQKISDFTGQFTGWVNPGQNNNADFGAVMPLIAPQRLFELQIGDFLSTKSDQISVLGQSIFLPSNLSLPKQKLRYGIFTFTVDKGLYDLPVPSPKKYDFVAITGRFPFQKVASTLMANDKSFLDILNDVSFEKEFQLFDQQITLPTYTHDFEIKKATPLTPCLPLVANQVPQNYKILGVSLVQDTTHLEKSYTVTDLKLIGSNAIGLGCLDKDPQQVTAAALGLSYVTTNKKVAFGKGFTIAVERNIKRPVTKAVEMNGFFEIPSVNVLNNGNKVVFSRVERKNITPDAVGYYAVLSEVLEDRDNANADLVEYNIPKWIVFSTETPQGQNAASFDLPVLPAGFIFPHFEPKRTKRWEVTWFANKFSNSTPANFDFNYFEEATHASRNSSDF